jgi:hypothetical protein
VPGQDNCFHTANYNQPGGRTASSPADYAAVARCCQRTAAD